MALGAITVLDILFSFLCATLGGMGVGGGSLFFLYLILFQKWDVTSAQQLNFLCFICAALVSLLRRPDRRSDYRPIPKAQWIRLLVCGCAGIILGRLLFFRLAQRSFRLFYGIFLCLCGCVGLLQKKKLSD